LKVTSLNEKVLAFLISYPAVWNKRTFFYAFVSFQFPLSKYQPGHTASFVHITADVPIIVPSNFSPTIRLVMASWMS
jgi:hypothetical protein